jgi:hypothetical protein
MIPCSNERCKAKVSEAKTASGWLWVWDTSAKIKSTRWQTFCSKGCLVEHHSRGRTEE